jgi:mono/diheme cytochrome c family protein
MRRVAKFFGFLVLALLVAAGGGLAYLFLAYPKAGAAPSWTVAGDAELSARGDYIANHVAVCIDCHSSRDWTRFSGPIKPGTEGMGGEVFDAKLGFPGTLRVPNITPAAIGKWTDGELARAFTSGVNAAGDPLFPLMPYKAYAHMCERDVQAVVAYVRTLAPVENQVPRSELDFPLNLIVRTIPGPPPPAAPCPEPAVNADYGKYLVTMASCVECHTPAVKGELIAGREFGGGRDFPMPTGILLSANISPDPETGIGKWTEEQFVARFKTYQGKTDMTVEGQAFNTIMPWIMYAGMSDTDLRAIYAYLRTVPPIANKVETFVAHPQ